MQHGARHNFQEHMHHSSTTCVASNGVHFDERLWQLRKRVYVISLLILLTHAIAAFFCVAITATRNTRTATT
jgi:hypothetical protein